MKTPRLRRIIFIAIAALLLIALIFLIAFYPKLTILNGYAAKAACSCTFVSGRSAHSILEEDLAFFPVSLARIDIDTAGGWTSADVFGLKRRKAVHVPGFGCTLLPAGIERVVETGPIAITSQVNGPDSLFWPYFERVAPLPDGATKDDLAAAVDRAFDAPGEDPYQKTRAVVIVHDGKLLYEKYAPGFGPETPILGWSMTKSILNTLVGILVLRDGYDIHQPLGIDAWAHDARSEITMHHLLQMSGGLAWEEDYGSLSDVTRMLYAVADIPEFVDDKTAEFAPGAFWEYSSGSSNLISGLIRKQFPQWQDYLRFPREALFDPIGMSTAVMEMDASGTFIGSSYCFATPRDWARFGLLYLQDGVWNGQRILPEGWVEYTRQPAAHSGGLYGAHFWLNVDHVAYADAPADLFSAEGFQGQRVFIIPSHDLVIVRMGLADSATFDFNDFLKGILDVFAANSFVD